MFTVVGESLVDLVRQAGATAPAAEHPGGSPANVALGLARLEAPVTLVTQLGRDARGATVRRHLTDAGVEVRTAGSHAATGTATAVLDEHGGATYDFRITWELPDDIALPADTVCLHTGSLATSIDPGARAVEALMARERNAGRVTVSFDPNIRPALLPSPEAARVRTERQVALADLVKVSEEDLAWLYPALSPLDLARRWQATGPAAVIVTLGGQGSLAVTARGVLRRPAPVIELKDTVGAGDAFTAGLLYALHRAGLLGGRRPLAEAEPETLAEAIDLATRTAAMTCEREGANPPTRTELDAQR